MRLLIAIFLVLCSTTFAVACIWDYDTLREERAKFPNALEIITGKFIRHSREFYEWRIEDRAKRLEDEPGNLALYDDLAVAYDKTGNHAEAIATILKKEAIKPGLYETAANLGTFFIHSGEFEEGLKHIERAIEINPDAHFGREVYQKYLVKYVLKHRTDEGIQLPLFKYHAPDLWTEDGVYLPEENPVGFAEFLTEQAGHRGSHPEAREARKIELQKAAKGIMGMMRFGRHESPILLEALGMVLASSSVHYADDAKQLAARAFLRAAAVSPNEDVAGDYTRLARSALSMQLTPGSNVDELPLSVVEAQLAEEVADAQEWFRDSIESDERKWIAENKEVEAMFDAKYREPVTHPYRDERTVVRTGTVLGFTVGGVAVLLLVTVVVAVRRLVVRPAESSD